MNLIYYMVLLVNGDAYISTLEERLPSILQIKRLKSKYDTVVSHLSHVKASALKTNTVTHQA